MVGATGIEPVTPTMSSAGSMCIHPQISAII